MTQFNTRDLGFAIRDHLEQHDVTHCSDLEESRAQVVVVDVSDANNLIVCLDNGQQFTVRIFAGAAS